VRLVRISSHKYRQGCLSPGLFSPERPFLAERLPFPAEWLRLPAEPLLFLAELKRFPPEQFFTPTGPNGANFS